MIGFNFVETSKRYVEKEVAREIVIERGERGYVDTVGVFQDHPLGEVFDVASDLELDRIQLHGSERNDQCRQLRKYGFKIIKSIPAEDRADYVSYDSVDLFIFDSNNPWSGESYDYAILNAVPANVPFLVAGWVSLETLGDVMSAVPDATGVDMASWVESDGMVDEHKIQEIVDYVIGLESSDE